MLTYETKQVDELKGQKPYREVLGPVQWG